MFILLQSIYTDIFTITIHNFFFVTLGDNSKDSFINLTEEIHKTDILIVSTGANTPTVTEAHLKAGKELLIIDLSMPENVDVSVKSLKGITLINVDELSKITDKTTRATKVNVTKYE